MERVQKLLAQAGIASRRKCEELISRGMVQVNGRVITLGDKASPKDKITVNGKPVKIENKLYIMFHKPKGYVTTVSESHGMKTVMQLVKVSERVFPVGRLDKNSEGLLLMTNDGALANKLTHPRYNVEKEYVVELDNPFKHETQLRKGVMIDDRKVKCRFTSRGNRVTVRIHEGRKHIVRRIFADLGYEVTRLVRTRMACLKLGRLQTGKWRELTKTELRELLDFLDDRARPA